VKRNLIDGRTEIGLKKNEVWASRRDGNFMRNLTSGIVLVCIRTLNSSIGRTQSKNHVWLARARECQPSNRGHKSQSTVPFYYYFVQLHTF
jgi:hypothetical protein